MSRWTECDPVSSDVDADLRSVAGILAGSVALRHEAGDVVLLVPASSVLAGSSAATLTVAADSEGPERAATLVFAPGHVASERVEELLRSVPASYLPDPSSLWLCELAGAPAEVFLEIQAGPGVTRRYELQPLRIRRSAGPPRPTTEKRREPPDNLKRRGDWFGSGTGRE